MIPWHGDDIAASRKARLLKHPRGVLLITPDVNRGSETPRLFAAAQHVVVDELHAFIGTDRGKQMQSLLHRIEHAADKRIPRVGLSATLGDMNLAASFLRPNDAQNVQLIISEAGGQKLLIQVRGNLCPAFVRAEGDADEDDDPTLGSENAIADHLYRVLRGTNNLVLGCSQPEI